MAYANFDVCCAHSLAWMVATMHLSSALCQFDCTNPHRIEIIIVHIALLAHLCYLKFENMIFAMWSVKHIGTMLNSQVWIMAIRSERLHKCILCMHCRHFQLSNAVLDRCECVCVRVADDYMELLQPSLFVKGLKSIQNNHSIRNAVLVPTKRFPKKWSITAMNSFSSMVACVWCDILTATAMLDGIFP